MSDGVKQALSLCEYMNWDPMEDFKTVVSSYDHLFWQDRENPWTFFPEPVLPLDWDRRLETKTKHNSKARKSIFVNEITGEVSTTPPTSSSESLSRVSCTHCIDLKLRVSLLTRQNRCKEPDEEVFIQSQQDFWCPKVMSMMSRCILIL
jgi:hypothetical protein